MQLIGQYDSPFVRRVAIALRLYGLAYDHLPWSIFGDAEKVATYNPLIRVPTLVLDDGTVLVESAAILDALDDRVGRDRAMAPATGQDRRRVLRIAAFASGAADKAVSLMYEQNLRASPLETWVGRCRSQVGGTLDLLERERAAIASPWWLGDRLTHADIMVGAMHCYVREALASALDLSRWPALAAHAQRCDALEAFRATYQPFTFIPPRS